MSDPVTNVEIEDVLSSIRRLVSNTQSDRSTETKAVPHEVSDAGAERLVLTPSLRVDGTRGADTAPDVAEAPPAEETLSDPMDIWESGPYPETPGQDSLSEDATTEDPEPENQEPDALEAEQPETEAQGEFEAEPQRDVQSELGTQAAEFEALVAGRDDQWEPDGASGDDYAGGPVSAISWTEAVEPSEEDEDSADPDWAEADDLASERHTQNWQDAEDAQESAEQSSGAGRTDALFMDDAVLDEDALRDLVAEIVRQELQGALGERITRNVRKLVRREIHRALTSQDFD
ncbi:hypothetical protein ACSSVY_003043 [Roseovarius sp. MBR-51]